LSGDSAARFHGVYHHDLLLPTDASAFAREIDSLIVILLKHGVLAEREGKIAFALRAPGLFMPALLEASLETVLWVWNNLLRNTDAISGEAPAATARSGSEAIRTVSYPKLMAHLQADFRAARYAGFVHRTEAASLTSLQSALDMLIAREIISIEEKGGVRHLIVVKSDATSEFEFLARAHHALRLWRGPTGRPLPSSVP
jgi:hypothetical protein